MHEQRTVFSDLPLFAEGKSLCEQRPDRYAAHCGVSDYDVAERRHGGNAASEAANVRAAPSKQQMREAVLAAVMRSRAQGLTLRELAARWAVPMHAVSGRFSELRDMGRIDRLQDEEGRCVMREGCGVWIDARLSPCSRNDTEVWR